MGGMLADGVSFLEIQRVRGLEFLGRGLNVHTDILLAQRNAREEQTVGLGLALIGQE